MNLLILDLDGTITRSDNIVRFSYFMIRKQKKLKFLFIFPLLLLLKTGLINNIRFKKWFALSIIRNLKVTYLQDCVSQYIQSQTFQNDLNPDVLDFINRHSNSDKVILSANFGFIVEPVSAFLNIADSIAISLISKQGKYTGQLSGNIPYGTEKIHFAQSLKGENNYIKIIGLADSKSDLPLLNFLDEGYLVKFDKAKQKTDFIKV